MTDNDATKNAPEVTPQETPQETPQGTKAPDALFDMSPTKPEPAKARTAAGATTTPAKAPVKKPEPKPVKKFKEGTEVRYQRHTMVLPKEMTVSEVIAWLGEDEFPEIVYEDVELRHDEQKNRIVPVKTAQKKGL